MGLVPFGGLRGLIRTIAWGVDRQAQVIVSIYVVFETKKANFLVSDRCQPLAYLASREESLPSVLGAKLGE